MANREITKSANAYRVSIFIGGMHDDVVAACRKFCDIVGLCVTVTPLTYVFTNGEEYGVEVGLINYARFPKDHSDIWNTALVLAEHLKIELQQGSYTVQDDERSVFKSTRDEDQ